MRARFAVVVAVATVVYPITADAGWVASWATAVDSPAPPLDKQTVRQIQRISIGGSRVRIRLSNLYGTAPLVIGPVHVAKQATAAVIQPGTDRVVLFAGKPTVTIPKGGDVTSDAIALKVAALDHLAVSAFVPAGSTTSTTHANAMQVAYIASGDATGVGNFPIAEVASSRFFLDGIDVDAGADARAVVAFGDSITDGIGSTPERDSRWPDLLATRLADPSAGLGVVNTGIAGNRILHDATSPFAGPSALTRFDRDVANRAGVHWVVLLEGINDIAAGDQLATPEAVVSVKQLTDGIKALVDRAHAKGLKIAVATLLPYGGVEWPYHSAAGEAKRQAVNAWIRSSSTLFDMMIDFERVMRDPAHPDRMLPAFDSGDHLHPSDAGYKAMADAIDIKALSR